MEFQQIRGGTKDLPLLSDLIMILLTDKCKYFKHLGLSLEFPNNFLFVTSEIFHFATIEQPPGAGAEGQQMTDILLVIANSK